MAKLYSDVVIYQHLEIYFKLYIQRLRHITNEKYYEEL